MVTASIPAVAFCIAFLRLLAVILLIRGFFRGCGLLQVAVGKAFGRQSRARARYKGAPA